LNKYEPNSNFKGWSLTAEEPYEYVIEYDSIAPIEDLESHIPVLKDENNHWGEQVLDRDKYDYIYYAVFEPRRYMTYFYDGNKQDYVSVIATEGVKLYPPDDFIPYLDDSKLELEKTYSHVGWRKLGTKEDVANADVTTTTTITDFSKGILVSGFTKFLPLFKQASVYDNVLSDAYFVKNLYTYNSDANYYEDSTAYDLSGC
jgi:hypothetical protein